MTIENITELFTLDGPSFVTEAYRNLVQREPDPHGLAYYLGRLAQGHDKSAVIVQLAQSKECRPHDEIEGLKKLIAAERHAGSWFWSFFERHRRMERTLKTGFTVLQTAHQNQATFTEQINQRLDRIHGALIAHVQIAEQNQHALQRLGQNTVTPQAGMVAPLTAETVRQAYRVVLGREPESEQTINNGLQAEGGLIGLYNTLLSSEEFQQRISRRKDEAVSYLPAASQQLGAHARQIYRDLESHIQKKNMEVV